MRKIFQYLYTSLKGIIMMAYLFFASVFITKNLTDGWYHDHFRFAVGYQYLEALGLLILGMGVLWIGFVAIVVWMIHDY